MCSKTDGGLNMTLSKDYKLRSLIPDRDYTPIRAFSIAEHAIKSVGESFYANMARVDSLSVFPPILARLAREIALFRPQLWKFDREPARAGGVDLHRLLLRHPVT
jgi:hypothetical protein